MSTKEQNNRYNGDTTSRPSCTDKKDKNVSNTLMVENGLPDDIHTEMAISFATCLFSQEFCELEGLLCDDVKMISYKKRTMNGKDEFVQYWKGLSDVLKADQIITDYAVKYNAFSGHAIVACNQKSVLGSAVGEAYIFLHLENGKISTAIITPKQLQPRMVRCYDQDKPPLDYDKIMHQKEEQISPESNRMPCLNCGRLSDELEWYKLEIDSGPYSHIGQISVCPYCKIQAEFYPEFFLRKL